MLDQIQQSLVGAMQVPHRTRYVRLLSMFQVVNSLIKVRAEAFKRLLRRSLRQRLPDTSANFTITGEQNMQASSGLLMQHLTLPPQVSMTLVATFIL